MALATPVADPGGPDEESERLEACEEEFDGVVEAGDGDEAATPWLELFIELLLTMLTSEGFFSIFILQHRG